MQPLRDRAHRLINLLSDDQLEVMWTIMKSHYYDLYMLDAIQVAKENFQPGDMLSRDEALQLLKLSPETTSHTL